MYYNVGTHLTIVNEMCLLIFDYIYFKFNQPCVFFFHGSQFLLGLSSGNHLAVPNVEMIPVRAFRLEPLSQGSHLVVDGELLKHSPVQAEIMPGITNVYARQKFSWCLVSGGLDRTRHKSDEYIIYNNVLYVICYFFIIF